MTSVIEAQSADVGAIVVINNESTSTSIGLLKNAIPNVKSVCDSPRIIGNELLVKPQSTSATENLDELSSLEREIAEMHHVDVVHENTESSGNNSGYSKSVDKNGINVNETVNKQCISTKTQLEFKNPASKDPISSGETSLEHEDLIAVLKGLDDTNNTDGDAELIEGVTIEGEGEYQIMEVVDEDQAPHDEATTALSTTGNAISPTKTFGPALLTSEKERALAMEQMECLKYKSRRRKQDIKPLKQSDSVMDLVSTLEAEWTDTDEDVKDILSANNSAEKNSNNEKKATIKHQDVKPALVTNVVVLPTIKKNSNSPITTDKTNSPVGMSTTTNMVGPKDSVTGKSASMDGIIETKTEEESQFMPTNTGFRRTRVIKRKIIWDPDAPETTFSYAKLVANTKPKVKQETSPIPNITITKGSTTIRPIKKETTANVQKKTQRPVTPKDKKLNADSNTTLEKKTNTIKNELDNRTVSKSRENSFSPVNVVSPAIKRRSQTPVGNGPGCGKKKKISELDRLMGDEGAVNMLNSLEKLESSFGTSETKPTRPMMRTRVATNCDKSALPKDSPTTIKHSSPTSSQQGNNKAKRNGKPRASSSWDYVYQQKQKNLDDSMIIRRRSNSSYSSNASVHRLSIDGPPTPLNVSASSTSKQNDTNLTPAPEADNKTPDDTETFNDGKSAGAITKTSSPSPSGGKSFEFAKPENKKAQKRIKSPGGTLTNDLKKPASAANKRTPRSATNEDGDNPEKNLPNRSPTNPSVAVKEKTHTSDVVVKKSAKVTQIIFSTNKAKISFTFTTQMLNKLVDILEKLATDPDTHVAVIISNDINFCQGVDLAELVASASAEKRKTAVKHLIAAVKKYLKTLAMFPKPLIVGVKGHVMNLGVMQLGLFDIVVAGDKCTYETPYIKLGQVPEGYSLWTSLNKIRGSFKTKLLWLSEKIQSTEAVLAGLVNKLTTSNKVNEEAVLIAKKIAAMSPEAYRIMKKSTSHSFLKVLESSFEEEFIAIAEQWSSPEFIGNIKNYLDQGHF